MGITTLGRVIHTLSSTGAIPLGFFSGISLRNSNSFIGLDAMGAEPSRNNKERDLEFELTMLSARYQKLLEEYNILVKDKENSDLLIKDLLNSYSWKITKPLRFGIRILRICWPPVKLFKVYPALVDCVDLTKNTDKSFSISGSCPYLGFQIPDRVSLAGWQKITFSTPKEIYFHLSFDLGAGYTDQYKRFITITPDSPSVSLEFPENVRKVRLDFFETGAPFSIDIRSIKSLSKLEATLNLAKQKLGPSPKYWFAKLKKGYELYKIGGMHALRIKLVGDENTNNYKEWVEKYDTLTEEDFNLMRKHIETLHYRPKFSVLLPTYNTPAEFLRKAIDSVRAQVYQDWELCIADDASPLPHVKNILHEYSAKDPRIKIVFREKNGHIAAASNTALSIATGEYVALLDHDDMLRPHALYLNAVELNNHREAKLIYSDEDKISTFDFRFNPYFKSDWNPELFLQQNFICHLTVLHKKTVDAVGGFRVGFEGSQDWDLFLRVIDAISEKDIRHIPHILYHWRAMEGSTAQSSSFKPYALTAGKRAIEEHLQRRKISGEVTILEAISQYRIHYALPKVLPLVTIIIPTKDKLTLLSRCIESILEKTTYKNFEIIIIDNGSLEEETLAYFKGISANPQVRVIRDDAPFNFSRLNNFAAKHANGTVLAFLNNDLEVITPAWLTEMLSHVCHQNVGAVGARLWYPNGLLQHGGVILGIGGVAGHNHKGQPRSNVGYFNRAILTQNLSAVTAACLLVRKEVFDEVKGFDEERLSVAFNDVDLCIRIREAGYKNVWTPYAELYHYESVSRGYEHTVEKFDRFQNETKSMKERWGTLLMVDPYYNPNLTIQSENFRLAFPPRTLLPWK